jgi:hypothetical protein
MNGEEGGPGDKGLGPFSSPSEHLLIFTIHKEQPTGALVMGKHLEQRRQMPSLDAPGIANNGCIQTCRDGFTEPQHVISFCSVI